MRVLVVMPAFISACSSNFVKITVRGLKSLKQHGQKREKSNRRQDKMMPWNFGRREMDGGQQPRVGYSHGGFWWKARSASRPGRPGNQWMGWWPNEGSHRDFRALLSQIMTLTNPWSGTLDAGKFCYRDNRDTGQGEAPAWNWPSWMSSGASRS